MLVFDKILSSIHFLIYLMLFVYKLRASSLISLVQPCHLICLFEGIALLSDGPIGVMISALILPSLSGTFLAILFPDTTGLDQPLEAIMYWVQHYLIIIVPVYLLVRKNGIALLMCDTYTICHGLWILTMLHFTFFEVRIVFVFNDEDLQLYGKYPN